MQTIDHRFPSFRDYIDRQERLWMSDADSTPLYAHPMDEWILRTLNSAPIKSVLDKSIDSYISTFSGQFLATGIFVDEKSFPELFTVLSRCSEILDIPIPHAVVNSDDQLFNAFTAGTDEYSFINITSGLSQYFTQDEACFVIGHECGHIAAKHLVYHTLVMILMEFATGALGTIGLLLSVTKAPLLAWSRRSEITADRAGLLCCGDIAIAERALLRLVAGFADIDRVDIDDYLRRAKEMDEFHSMSGWQKAFLSHPLIPKRIEALRLFAKSELYYDLTTKPRPEGVQLLSRPELDRRVNDLVKP
jgi:Zn-dependent protease with chaperone function